MRSLTLHLKILITLLVVAAMLPWFAGLLVAGPVIGHATWHAYRETIDASAWPPSELCAGD